MWAVCTATPGPRARYREASPGQRADPASRDGTLGWCAGRAGILAKVGIQQKFLLLGFEKDLWESGKIAGNRLRGAQKSHFPCAQGRAGPRAKRIGVFSTELYINPQNLRGPAKKKKRPRGGEFKFLLFENSKNRADSDLAPSTCAINAPFPALCASAHTCGSY